MMEEKDGKPGIDRLKGEKMYEQIKDEEQASQRSERRKGGMMNEGEEMYKMDEKLPNMCK